MPWRYVKQPNGKLALFDEEIDDFRYTDLSEFEAEALATGYGLSEHGAKQKVQAGVEDWEPWKHQIKGDGQSRWREAIETIRFRFGDEKAEIIISACSAVD
tara:strand:+ start:100108 stop:100410 length:303 start_codon:yes stop_codon:yes gene_type:complete